MSARTTAQAKLIVEGMAYALWVHALSGYAFDETGHEIAGRTRWAEEYDELVHEGRGSVPDAAMEPAMELVNLYEITNGRTLVSMYSDVPFGYFTDAYDYGEALASRALGLPDDTMLAKRARALNNVEPVHFEISFTGEKLVWTGDSQPPTTNPSKKYVVGDRVTVDDHKEGGDTWRGTVITVEEDGWTQVEDANGRRHWRVPSELSRSNPHANPADQWGVSTMRFALDGGEQEVVRVFDTEADARDYSRQLRAQDLRHTMSRIGRARRAYLERGVASGRVHVIGSLQTNPAAGPTRAGERSRHRATLRGLERTTAVIPARSRAEQEAAELREKERRAARRRKR